MKRYFLVPPGALPSELPDMPYVGEYHYIILDSLGSAGQGNRVLVLMDQSKAPPASWMQLPALLDAVTTLGSMPAPAPAAAAAAPAVQGQTTPAPAPVATPLALLADVGAQATHTAYTLAKQLATIHPMFAP
ncbi:MAG TPA: hypothetical protein VK803_08005 [Steroidobacteraceae bacterium]|jgi:hypothetical protein|nr:hypothetical protein [Steroidobacteraceae bacterium]